MTSPDSKAKDEGGGGMLPALLAGAGILLIGALLFFGGDDDEKKEAKQGKGRAEVSANANTAANAGASGGVASRTVDDAKPNPTAAKPKLNPRVESAIVNTGMSPAPKPEVPSSFGSVQDEITYWEDRLVAANRNLEIREQAMERTPKIEEKIRNGNDPENGLIEFEKRKQVVKDNLEKAQASVEELEAKIDKLRG